MTNSYFQDEIKRKVRKLKKVEFKIRFNRDKAPDDSRIRIVWDEFFNINSNKPGIGKYTLDMLASLSKEDYIKVINEFFFKVYEQYYAENALSRTFVKDTNKLELLGLPYDADQYAIKTKFRELAKEYHPDHGGDQEKFVWLMELYKELTR
ncbi:MAG TPA: J domain-containing protein [Clostridiales bacterium]|nr:J domain-containing protein [Clostridiales bacterium]